MLNPLLNIFSGFDQQRKDFNYEDHNYTSSSPDIYLPLRYYETRVMYCRFHKAFHSSLQKFYFILLFLFVVTTEGDVQDHTFARNLSY